MPFTCAFAKKQVESERKDIDSIENTIVVNGCPLRAVTKVRTWNKDHKVYTHIYYNVRKASGIRVVLISNDVKDAEHAMQGKLFVGFLACVLMAEINKTMAEHDMYKNYTMRELLNILAKLRVQDINGRRILYPVTKEQRLIYEAFGVALPTE